MEYDDVYLVEDFITEEKLNQILTEKKEEEINREKLNEEINLLYVAINPFSSPKVLISFEIYDPSTELTINTHFFGPVYLFGFPNSWKKH